MSFFSTWGKAILLIVLTFPLHSETSFRSSKHTRQTQPDCDVYKDRLQACTREWFPVCATNGQTYSNKCLFCIAMLESNRKFGFDHYGAC